jgi:phosphoribosyl 1,2-cyclic phosphate phosphodiesterase
MKVTFLGTGTSQGVPVIGCPCEVCNSSNSKDKRLRVSVQIEIKNKTLVIDSGPDFRQQMLRKGTKKLDALLFTHEHKDHIAGMDDIRAFNYLTKKPVEIYASLRVQNALRKEFSYVFEDDKYPGIPEINMHEISNNLPFKAAGIEIIPIEVFHYKLPVLGFRIGNFTYITDANKIEPHEKEKIKGSKVLVLNALEVERTYFTHMSHQMGLHNDLSNELPQGFYLAYDELEIDI